MHDVVAREARAHVLVIDDDPDFREFMQLLLSSEGYQGTVVGRDATYVRGRDDRPDVVLCDPFGPLILDVTLLERLAETPTTRDVPVILCTGAVHRLNDARTYLAHHRAEVLLKPFDLDDLLTCIERVRGASISELSA